MRGAAPRVLVVGAGTVGSAVALALAKSGRHVTLAVRDPAFLTFLTSDRKLVLGSQKVPMPPNVSLASSTNVDQMGENLLSSLAVVSCVPACAVVPALEQVATAAKDLPSLAPAEDVFGKIDGAVPLDADVAASGGDPGRSLAQSLPFIVFSQGAADTGKLVYPTRSLQAAYPHLASCFAANGRATVAEWIASSVAAPAVRGDSDVPQSGDKQRRLQPVKIWREANGSRRHVPTLMIGAAASASIRARDAVTRALGPFEIDWALDPLQDHDAAVSSVVARDAAEVVQFASMCRIACAFAGGVINSHAGASVTGAADIASNVGAGANTFLKNVKERPLSSSAMASMSLAAVDSTDVFYRFGRQLGSTDSVEDAATLALPGGHKSVYRDVLANTLETLRPLHGFFDGLADTASGYYRASTVAPTLGSQAVDWEATTDEMGETMAAIYKLDTASVDGHESAGAAAREAAQVLERLYGSPLTRSGQPQEPRYGNAGPFDMSAEERK
jgi:hypothetical protein